MQSLHLSNIRTDQFLKGRKIFTVALVGMNLHHSLIGSVAKGPTIEMKLISCCSDKEESVFAEI